MDESIPEQIAGERYDQRPPSLLDLLFITRAHNRREINYEEWLQRTREWAEAIKRWYGDDEGCHLPPVSGDR